MKKIVFALTIALMGTIVMNAQPPRRPNMDPERMVANQVERLDKNLSLTDEQKAEITKIYTEEMKTMHMDKPAKMEKGSTPDRAEMKAYADKMKAQRDAVDAKVEAVLTPEQLAKYAEMKEKEGDRKGHRNFHKKPHGGPDMAPPSEGCCKDCKCCEKKEQ